MLKYAILGYNNKDIDDDIQSFVISTLIPISYIIMSNDYNKIYDYNTSKEVNVLNDSVYLIMNNFSNKNIINLINNRHIVPIYISYSLPKDPCILNDNKCIEYLKKYSPILCKDKRSINLLQKYNVNSKYFGCLTQLLDKKDIPDNAEYKKYTDKILCIEPTKELWQSVHKKKEYVRIWHKLPNIINMNPKERINYACKLLSQYKYAKKIYTTSIYSYRACKAIGIDITYDGKEKDNLLDNNLDKQAFKKCFMDYLLSKINNTKYIDSCLDNKNSSTKKYFIDSRHDRYGANSMQWIPALFLSIENNVELQHICSHCKRNDLKNSVLHEFLLSNTKYAIDKDTICLTNYNGTYLENEIKYIISKYKNLPFPDIFHNSKTHKKIIKFYKNIADKSKWNIPNDVSESIIIHVRLDDKCCSIDNNSNRQSFIGLTKLNKIIINLQEKNVQTKIYLMTSPNKRDLNMLNKFINDSNIKNVKVLSNTDKDIDIYIMSQCKLLIMSKSSFALIGGLLNVNNRVYTYERWWHYDDLLGNNKHLSNKFNIL